MLHQIPLVYNCGTTSGVVFFLKKKTPFFNIDKKREFHPDAWRVLCFHGQPVSIPKLIVIDLAEYQRPLSSPQIENTRREPSREEKRLLVFFCLFFLFRLEFMIIQISIFSFFSLRPSNEYIEKKAGYGNFMSLSASSASYLPS